MLLMITVFIQVWLLEKWINKACIAAHSYLSMKRQECMYVLCGRKGEIARMCCADGKVKLPELLSPPVPLSTLVSGDTSLSKNFSANKRENNSCFQMTSFGATINVRENYTPTCKVQGPIYHRAGSLLPLPSADHKVFQIYFMGTLMSKSINVVDLLRALNEKLSLNYKIDSINATN